MTSPALLDDLARRFEYHGAHIYGSSDPHNSSPLYAALSLSIARDPDILALMVEADRATQVSNLLLGAAHYLLLRDPAQPLALYYRSLTANPLPPEEAYPHFRAFCLAYAEDTRALVTTRRIQTNEVGRCTALVPAFEAARRRHPDKPLALVEIGASAGLHLRWDRYQYYYQPGGVIGPADASVRLPCEVRGGGPPLPASLPEVIWRVGIDLNPLDVNDSDAMRWLRALIWPEQTDRAILFKQAVAEARLDPPRVVAGNALDVLAPLIAEAPPDAHLVIFHSYTFNQMPKGTASRINEAIIGASRSRDLTRIGLEWWGDTPLPELSLTAYRRGQIETTSLAVCESHGRWLEWQHLAAI